ncbi:MAG TPA: hypothetical protein VHS59_14745 [Bacillota bacterium]|nr:hypothetical protein [Bacillota bacterium]
MKENCCAIKGEDKYVVCPTCQNKITDLTALRCPRCFTSLIKLGCDGNCRKCGKKN